MGEETVTEYETTEPKTVEKTRVIQVCDLCAVSEDDGERIITLDHVADVGFKLNVDSAKEHVGKLGATPSMRDRVYRDVGEELLEQRNSVVSVEPSFSVDLCQTCVEELIEDEVPEEALNSDRVATAGSDERDQTDTPEFEGQELGYASSSATMFSGKIYSMFKFLFYSLLIWAVLNFAAEAQIVFNSPV